MNFGTMDEYDEKMEHILRPLWVGSCKDADLISLKSKGNAQFKNGNYGKAMAYYLAILHRTKHTNTKSAMIVDAWNNVGLLYFVCCPLCTLSGDILRTHSASCFVSENQAIS